VIVDAEAIGLPDFYTRGFDGVAIGIQHLSIEDEDIARRLYGINKFGNIAHSVILRGGDAYHCGYKDSEKQYTVNQFHGETFQKLWAITIQRDLKLA
jgi:hypothetical protein